ncbi:hypothetical protein BaRGS_00003273 [Batillaria attramentaria]|uniref:ARID domain-containing protein n=1 Tax=Batillaria attramentaria TaxID=370345 RepID=A0ABD0M2B6_9CAEN
MQTLTAACKSHAFQTTRHSKASYEPAFLPIGTDVSAKYRGAFCEAKVKKVIKSVKCKIILKDSQTSIIVTDENITGPLKVGSNVEVKHPDSGQQAEGVINKVTDCSTYTVVFDDADERTLRRTQLCLKGEKHFMESETLDNLPLSNPEHFGTPVLQNKKARRGKPGESESEDEESSSEDEAPRRAVYKGRYQELVGKVMCMESSDKRKGALTPVVVVLPDAQPVELKNREQLLVRSFRDAKFLVVNRKDLKDFSREIAIKSEDKNMKAAFEKALLYYDSHELPPNWKREELLGPDDDSDEEEDDTSDDDEPCEEKDRFVAQLYKFMDDRGTPINKGPCVGNKDLNLYRLFRVVQNIGGYNRVTNQMKWRLVYSKMGLPPSNTASHQIKNAYKKYLHAFEDFYRKLGSTMGTISRPGRSSRQSSGRGILAFRGREKDSSPRSPRTEKTVPKDDKSKEEEKPKSKPADGGQTEETEDAGDSTPMEESDNEIVRRSTPRREKAQKEEPKSEKKDDAKTKKEKEEEKKEEVKKEEVKEERKKEEKREERKSLRHSLKEEEKREVGKTKEEGKKEEGKTDRVLRRERDEKEEEVKKEPEENKDAQKKRVTRRKSGRFEEEKKDSDEKEEEEKSEPDKTLKDKKEKKPIVTRKEKSARKKPEEEDGAESKDKESEEAESEDESVADGQEQEEYPAGTKLRVKYGRGRNQKIYEAKVVESGKEGPHKNYLVHYAGWNTRYDEWVRSERIVAVVDKPEMTKLKKKAQLLKTPKGASSPKPETPLPKKRGRQPSVQQVPSPSPAPAVKTASPASEAKTPKGKSTTAASGSASKTRSTRSNSTEIKAPEGLPAPTKHRITRRSSGLNDTVEEPSAADQDDVSESDVESEAAPPSASGGDLTSEREEDEELKGVLSGDLDMSMEEGVEPLDTKEQELEQAALVDKGEKENAAKKTDQASESEGFDVAGKAMPDIFTKESDLGVSASVPSPLFEPKTVAGSVAPVCEKNEASVESVKEESVKLPEAALPASTVEHKPEPVMTKAEEAKPAVLKPKDEAATREGNLSTETPEMEPKLEPPVSQAEKSEEEKLPKLEEPTIPELKKIEMDVLPEEKREVKEKEKFKVGKKTAKDVRKGRQSEMRTSLSEIPTLEPMTTPVEVKPKVEVTPSPYDFTESELDSPWQPEITKKWEPNNKTPPLFRDAKQELKKSLETDKKKVKKKPKKTDEMGSPEKSNSVEPQPKPDEDKTKDSSAEPQDDKPPPKKKGRKKKELSADIQKDISAYEETVNSVVESCRLSAESSAPLPVAEEKKEKPVKKRKNKTLEAAGAVAEEKDGLDASKKEPAKKGVKGKGKKKLKDGKALEDSVSEPPETVSQSGFGLIVQASEAAASSRREKRARSQSPEPATSKQARQDPSVLSVSAAPPLVSSAAVTSKVGLPGVPVSSGVSVKHEPGTSGVSGAGPSGVVPAPPEGPASVRLQGPEPRGMDYAAKAPQAGMVAVNTVLDNTPPTTPENDLDEANSGSSSDAHDNLKDDLESLDSMERTSKVGSESPSGCDYSLSSASSENLPSNKSAPQPSKSSEAEASTSGSKRKRNVSDDGSMKKKRRQTSRGCRSERNKKSPKYGDEDSQSRSAIDLMLAADLHTSSMSPSCKTELPKVGTPRPPKFHFTDDLGQHLAGEQRISFLMSKIMEIRKEYSRIKSEIAAIDRKRKRARRREKEKESSQTSQGEREDS